MGTEWARDGHGLPGHGFFCKKIALENTVFSRAYVWLRGPDLNRRPSGYEPDELPLLHPALLGVRLKGLNPKRGEL